MRACVRDNITNLGRFLQKSMIVLCDVVFDLRWSHISKLMLVLTLLKTLNINDCSNRLKVHTTVNITSIMTPITYFINLTKLGIIVLPLHQL